MPWFVVYVGLNSPTAVDVLDGPYGSIDEAQARAFVIGGNEIWSASKVEELLKEV